jgi:hypothetical protein
MKYEYFFVFWSLNSDILSWVMIGTHTFSTVDTAFDFTARHFRNTCRAFSRRVNLEGGNDRFLVWFMWE